MKTVTTVLMVAVMALFGEAHSPAEKKAHATVAMCVHGSEGDPS